MNSLMGKNDDGKPTQGLLGSEDNLDSEAGTKSGGQLERGETILTEATSNGSSSEGLQTNVEGKGRRKKKRKMPKTMKESIVDFLKSKKTHKASFQLILDHISSELDFIRKKDLSRYKVFLIFPGAFH